MEFIGSTSYYALCIIGIIILIALLISLQKKPKSTLKLQADCQQSSTKHIPKYAAGDDMDQINRNAYALWSKKKTSWKEIPVIVIGIILLLAILASELPHAKPQQPSPAISTPTSPMHANPATPATTPIPAPVGGLESEFILAEYNKDYTKLYATYSYTNKFTINIYSIVATIELRDENENVIQTIVADTIETLKPDETKEITTSITIEPENIGKVKRVEIHTAYQQK